MKKILLLFAIIGFLVSCAGDKKSSNQASEAVSDPVEVIEQTIQNLNEAVELTEMELRKTQSEIDSLLSGI